MSGYEFDPKDKDESLIDRFDCYCKEVIGRAAHKEKAVMKPEDFNVSVYAHKVFEMFDGDEVRVKLECKNSLMKYVIDRFGMDVETEPLNGETFICYPDVRLSPTLYGWVFGFKGGIKILESEVAVREMTDMAEQVLKK